MGLTDEGEQESTEARLPDLFGSERTVFLDFTVATL
jgi:hypothetical protein